MSSFQYVRVSNIERDACRTTEAVRGSEDKDETAAVAIVPGYASGMKVAFDRCREWKKHPEPVTAASSRSPLNDSHGRAGWAGRCEGETEQMTTTLVEELVAAEEPSTEFRSIWTDLRQVAFDQGFLDVKGTTVRYIRSGAGNARKLVMLPGTGGHAETFAPNLGPLGAEFEVWAIDIPGCGYSDKPAGPESYDGFYMADFLKDMAEVIGAETLCLAGCSVGALAAVRTALAHPDLVEKIILVSPSGLTPNEDDEWYQLWHLPDIIEAMGDAAEARKEIVQEPTWEAAKTILTSLIPDARRLPDDFIAARLDVNRQPQAHDVFTKVYWWTDHDIRLANGFSREDLAGLTTPVMGVCEFDDRMLPIVNAMFEVLPNAKLYRVEGVGHWAHYEAPGQFNAWALEFLHS